MTLSGGDAVGSAPARRATWARFKRLVTACAVLLLLAGLWFGEYVWRGKRAEARMAAAGAALRASGRPASVDDLKPEPVPDDDNAVVLLRQAAAALKPDGDPVWAVQDTDEPLTWRLTDAEAAGLAQLVAAHGETLDLVRRAGQRPRAEWALQFTRPMIEMPMPDLHEQRRVAWVLDATVLHAHHAGDDAAALAYLGDWLSLARALHRHPTIVGHLVALGSGARAADLAAQMAAELRAAPPSAGLPGGGPDDVRSRARDLIAGLLDKSAIVEGRMHALRTERVSALDGLHSILDGKFSTQVGDRGTPDQIPWHRRPAVAEMLGKNHALLLRHFALHEETAAADWPAYAARVPEMPPEAARDDTDHYLLTRITMPSLWRAMQMHYRALAERRLAATCLAARLYALDHGGSLPEKLDDLVPQYLPSVPLDPLAAGGTPLRYVNERTDPQRPRVYSVGRDGSDHGGTDPDPTAPRRVNETTTDLVRHLKRQPRKVPATQPLEGMYPSVSPGAKDEKAVAR